MAPRVLLTVLAVAVIGTTAAYNNGMGWTPQMGWNSWNHFACNINQTLIRDTITTMSVSGLSKVGYQFVNMDDCWAGWRDSNGIIHPDNKTFPDGVKPLADYAHAGGLKFGLYSSAGTLTCAGRPGSLGYEKNDADTYASWGVDYLKYDNCYNENISPLIRYPAMGKALNESGRHIFYSLCEWGQDNPAVWGGAVSNSWRTTPDIKDNWDSMYLRILWNEPLWPYATHTAWNDPDMLEVGNGGMTTTEYITHFTFWAAMKAPLLIGTNIQAMSDDTKMILTNTDVIAINQDAMAVQAHRVWSSASPAAQLGASTLLTTQCHAGAKYQQWSVDSQGKFTEAADGRCMDIDECDTGDNESGNNVSAYPCHGSESEGSCNGVNQQWTVQKNGTITSQLDGQCLTVYPVNGANPSLRGWDVVTMPCVAGGDGKPTANQVWAMNSDGTVTSALNGDCLTVLIDVTPGQQEVWAGPLAGGDVVIILFNPSAAAATVTANWADVGLTGSARIYDLWLHKHMGTFDNSYTAKVESHGVVAVRASLV